MTRYGPSIFVFVMLQWGPSLAVATASTASRNSYSLASDTIKTLLGGRIKYYGGVGGPAVKLSRYNGHCAFMTGGRGAGIINHGLNIGGGGYGIANAIPLQSQSPDTSRYLTMG